MRTLAVVTSASLTVVLALAGVSTKLFVFPPTGRPLPADAIVVLAGDPETRLPLAVDLAEEGPHVLVVSAADGQVNEPARALCTAPPSALTVYCFTPESPQSTWTEARGVGRLATQHGWTRFTVVTSTYHVVRAGLLVRRCTGATVTVVGARPLISGVVWVWYAGKELAGLGETVVTSSC